MAGLRVWLLLGDKLGDNAQVLRVAAELAARGWQVERRNLVFHKAFRKGKPPFLASLYHVDRKASDALAPPWPDLVLTVGRRPMMAAAWIKRRAPATRVVLFGRPRGGGGHLDLAVAPVQYAVAEGQCPVLPLQLPLIFPDPQRLAAAAAAPRFSGLPRPLTAVLVGGATQPFVLDAAVATDLLTRVRAMTGDTGSLLVTTSRRTGAEATAAIAAALPAGGQLYRWGDPGPNPYLHLLAEADRFVVTGDSVSMMVEVARQGRPLALAALPETSHPGGRLRHRLQALGKRLGFGSSGGSRDLTAVHKSLVAGGHAVPLGDSWGLPVAPPADETQQVVERIQSLFGTTERQV